MVINLSAQHSLLTNYVAELRNVQVQQDRLRFRRNLERIGEIIGYEISKKLPYTTVDITTPMGIAPSMVLQEQPILATILRAGLPLHQGLLNYYDRGDNAFISAYRKHNDDDTFDICLDYISSPELDDRIIILSDPMLATGSSLVKTIQYLRAEGKPKAIHVVAAIACTVGIEYVLRAEPTATVWCAAIDEEITAKGYIVPGLGDAGDLAYGSKMQR